MNVPAAIGNVLLGFAFFANQSFDRNGAVVQVHFGEVVHAVAAVGIQEIMGNHRIEQIAFKIYTIKL